jgi:hypothetical protein
MRLYFSPQTNSSSIKVHKDQFGMDRQRGFLDQLDLADTRRDFTHDFRRRFEEGEFLQPDHPHYAAGDFLTRAMVNRAEDVYQQTIQPLEDDLNERVGRVIRRENERLARLDRRASRHQRAVRSHSNQPPRIVQRNAFVRDPWARARSESPPGTRPRNYHRRNRHERRNRREPNVLQAIVGSVTGLVRSFGRLFSGPTPSRSSHRHSNRSHGHGSRNTRSGRGSGRPRRRN